MASAEQLKALIHSYVGRDDAQFYAIAMQVAAHEAKLGHGKLAMELRHLIDAGKARLSQDSAGKLVPIAGALNLAHKQRGELAQLLSVTHPVHRLSDMVLDESVLNALTRIIKEQRMLARIKQHGLSPRRKLLLVGPPGTGKTMTASVLAGELGLPLFLVRLDALITKFMGETAAKLRQVFEAIADIRGVYFFDEFDAIGSQRASTNDVGEIRRVLNSFLQMIEQDQSNSLIIAATNHPDVLDSALFRRFDDVVAYHLPSSAQAAALIRARLGGFAPTRIDGATLAESTQQLSYAEIGRAVDEAIKAAIMHDQNKVQQAALIQSLEERRLMSAKLAQINTHSLTPAANYAGTRSR